MPFLHFELSSLPKLHARTSPTLKIYKKRASIAPSKTKSSKKTESRPSFKLREGLDCKIFPLLNVVGGIDCEQQPLLRVVGTIDRNQRLLLCSVGSRDSSFFCPQKRIILLIGVLRYFSVRIVLEHHSKASKTRKMRLFIVRLSNFRNMIVDFSFIFIS